VTLHVKWGTTWNPIELGDINVKWGSLGWVQPAKVYVKWGSAWVDSGYIGPPGVPRNLRVKAWNYDQMTVAWDAPAGDTGADPTHYHILRREFPFGPDNDINNQLKPATDPRERVFNVADMTRYRTWIRSYISTNGKYSAWIGPLDVKIGRPAQPGQAEIKNQIISSGSFPPGSVTPP
jgi:hypothetical protein